MPTTDDYTLRTPTQLRELLVSFRKRRKLSQAALAELLGVSQQSYAQIEANPMSTSVERLYRILRLLDVELTLTATRPTGAQGEVAPTPAKRLPAATSKAVKTTRTVAKPKADPKPRPAKSGNAPPLKIVPPTVSEKDRW